MLAFLLYRVLCGLLGLLVRAGVDDRELEIAVLRHQLRILSRRGKGPRYRTADRALLAATSQFLPRERWSAFSVAPDTLNRWRRNLLSRKASNRRRPGRPPIDRAVRELILRMARENPRWGYLRIKGELLKLGITVSATTIANVLRRGGLGPAPRRIGPTWPQFLRAQALAILGPGGPQGSDQEDRDRHGQAPTPAPDSGDRPSLQKEWSPGDALAASAPVGVSGRGWELPSEVRQNRSVRMPAARSFPVGSARPRDGPAPLGFLLP
ncbi:MAG TPA: helix-turn-helix domain-containing protein, partial [Actinomycetota bacterium]|nr:helix-turn-helix domain-containing protein [Actinomycetota bacterium]